MEKYNLKTVPISDVIDRGELFGGLDKNLKTIEEKIIALQTKKAELYDIAVNGEGDIMHMSAADIMSILE